MVNRDGIASAAPTQEKNVLPPHVVRAAGFALRRGLGLVALCGADCDNQRHGRKGHVSTARGKVPLRAGWSANPIRRLEDLPSNTGNIGIVCGFEVDSLDIDDEAGLAWAVANQPETPWRVKTGSGGEHWYFKRRPGDLRTGMVLSLPEGKSLHFRGEDSLVVAPHSTHWTGKNYQPVGDWGVPFSALPYFNREAAEKIRGLNIRGVKEVGRSTQAAAMREGRLPLTGSWSQDEIETLLDGAYERIKPEFRSAVFRKHKFIRFLEKQAPCRAGAATGEAMNVLRVGLVNLLLPAPLVLDLAAASEWATKATEADGVTAWPWKREQLADLVDRVLRTTWADRFGYWVSEPSPKSAAPAPEAAAPAAPAAEGEVTP